jgi:hypothetical protein
VLSVCVIFPIYRSQRNRLVLSLSLSLSLSPVHLVSFRTAMAADADGRGQRTLADAVPCQVAASEPSAQGQVLVSASVPCCALLLLAPETRSGSSCTCGGPKSSIGRTGEASMQSKTVLTGSTSAPSSGSLFLLLSWSFEDRRYYNRISEHSFISRTCTLSMRSRTSQGEFKDNGPLGPALLR